MKRTKQYTADKKKREMNKWGKVCDMKVNGSCD